MMKYTILDGYSDEPSCLGVPPFISPHPRYIYGSIKTHDRNAQISYVTIDNLRSDKKLIEKIEKSDVLIILSGVLVPGKYLGGSPISHKEIKQYAKLFDHPFKILCGACTEYGIGTEGGKKTIDVKYYKDDFDLICYGDAEMIIAELIKARFNIEKVDNSQKRKNQDEIAKYAQLGAEIVRQHPNFWDNLICEIETFRGCSRYLTGGCSFCIESKKGKPIVREINDIVSEVKVLYDLGVRHFRLGNQTDFFVYKSDELGEREFPRPNPDAIEKLYRGIRECAPKIETLHIDNVNPKTIAKYPKESEEIARCIVKYGTSGNVAALGIESVDPKVIEANNLKSSEDESLFAIELINKIGKDVGYNGLPNFLPGLNFIFGLKNESEETLKLTYEFLQEILDRNLLVRRINIRKVMLHQKTSISKSFLKKNMYFKWKKKIREEIEPKILQKVLPFGTVLRDVRAEQYDGNSTFARQLSTYPILCYIPKKLAIGKRYELSVTNYGSRSVTCLEYPFDINSCSMKELEAIDGINKKLASKIVLKRPITSKILNEILNPKISKKIEQLIGR